jgi:choice-of-anchor B domain-containing protein
MTIGPSDRAVLRTTLLATVLALAGTTAAHEDTQFEQDRIPPYDGPGYTNTLGGAPPIAFPASGVTLLSWIPLVDFDPATVSGDDCWGYVSPGGREYAIIGLSLGTAFVDVTDPGDPQVVEIIPGPTSTWRDIKTYQTWAYAVSEAGDGIQVIDLAQIDSGVVTLTGTVTAGGTLSTTATHNVAIDPVSGTLVRCGGGSGTIGLRIYDIATDPANPQFTGEWHPRYVHDAQIVTWNDPPFAGQVIAFCFSDTDSGGGNPGLDILNITNPASVTSIGFTNYSSPVFSHQGWLSPDRSLCYVNDELDETNFGTPTTTRIVDISDLTNPFETGTFTNGNTSIDHNLYTLGNLIFEANYRSGLRIFDATDPLNPVETAFFDTWPEDDNANFNGLWNVYPYLPSGVILGSDIEKGLFVWWLGDPQLAFGFPNGVPGQLSPNGDRIYVQITEQAGGTLVPGTAKLTWDDGGGPQVITMTSLGDGLYEAVLPALACGADVRFFVSGETPNGITWRDPFGAPNNAYVASAVSGVLVNVQDDFEVDQGWTPANLGATSGDWQRGVPVDDPTWAYDPATDSDGSGQCWLTQNATGNTDIDDGSVELVSAAYDLSSGTVRIGYDYFLRLTNQDGTDKILVEISSNGLAGPWTEVARHDTDGGLAWRSATIGQPTLDAAGVTMTSDMRLRFTANDGDTQSINESGLDAIRIEDVVCMPPGDVNGDLVIDVADLLAVLGAWGPCPVAPTPCPIDVNNDRVIDVADLLLVLANWG